MSHTFLTVAVPFDGGKADAVNVKLDEYGNPVIKDIRDMLRGSSVHFISINVLPADSDHGAFLVIEANQDGDKQSAIGDLAKRLNQPLREIMFVAGHDTDEDDLADFLDKHSRETGLGLFSTPGLNHTGSPGMTVGRIRSEWDFARKARELANDETVSGTPLQILSHVRAKMAGNPGFSSLMTADEVIFTQHDRTASLPIAKMVWDSLKTFTWPFLLVVAAAMTLVIYFAAISSGIAFAIAMGFLTLLLGVVILLVGIGVLYARLRGKE
ncbi:MAG: hypothetical protein ACR2PF_11555, partial [Rhizobiaceae bacterium]